MNPSSQDVKDMLESSQHGSVGTFGTDLFVHEEPASPDACVTVRDTGGSDPEARFDYRRPTVQVRIRGARGDYLDAYSKAMDVRDALHGVNNETWNGTRYILILQMGDVLDAGNDDSGRPILTVNFRIHRTE